MISKPVLIVTYHFPPDGGSSGVLRPLKFAKYLPQFGWIPHILTVKPHFYESLDWSLEQEVVSEIDIHRTRAIVISRHLAIAGRYPGFLAVPDRMVGWIPFALREAVRLIRKYPIAAIYSTAPPPSAHLIGYWLKRWTHIPWVADYRDPWVDAVHPPMGSLRRKIETRMEEKILEQADRIVATTPALLHQILTHYPQSRDRQGTVIYNGYDEADFAADMVCAQPPVFELLHAGLITKQYRNPEPLMRAMARLIQTGQMLKEDVRLTFLSGVGWIQSQEFQDMIDRFGLDGVVLVEPRVSHEQALRRMQQAAVLVGIQASDDTRVLIPAKIFEYLRIGRPIVVIADEGETSSLVRQFAGCWSIEPFDHERLCTVLRALYQAWKRGESQWFYRELKQFDRMALTGKLAEVLNQCFTVRQAECANSANFPMPEKDF